MQIHRISYSETGKFSALVNDYIGRKPQLMQFFHRLPDAENFAAQMEEKANFSRAQRQVLAERLSAQYAHLNLPKPEQHKVDERIAALKNEHTFTVTTGHQLCLFSGPLFTIYKIAHAIRTAEELNKKFPENKVLPIFWMATEDHDFAEVNHVHFKGHKLVWHAEAGDAVGRMKTEGIENVIDQLAAHLPKSNHADALLANLKTAYLQQENLAKATRTLVHNWFKNTDLLILDGDDAELKRAMIPAFSQELTEQTSAKAVEATNAKLVEHYKIQVTPRDINLFYLRDGLRSRIVENEGVFAALETSHNWSREEVLSELENHPERFSPNVLLRPLYQETILPNLAYIGGGGELAYWAQQKEMFAQFGVPFPIVMLRQSVQIETKVLALKREKIGLDWQTLLGDVHRASAQIVREECDFDDEIHQQAKAVKKAFDEIKAAAKNIDVTLEMHVEAQKTRALKSITGIEKKMLRAAKKQDNDRLRMLHEWRAGNLPGGGLQERHNNILAHWQRPDFLTDLMNAIEPLSEQFLVIVEE